MSPSLLPPKLILLAVHFATSGDVDSLASLALECPSALPTELLLRILLTYLPETTKFDAYVPLLNHLRNGGPSLSQHVTVDRSFVVHMSDNEAAKKVKKLRLLQLSWPEAPEEARDDPFTLFLLHRAYRVDEGAHMLAQLPDLLVPFLDHSPCIRTWTISTLIPFMRRSVEYYVENMPVNLLGFSKLDDPAAAALLLSQTAAHDDSYNLIGRDLKGIISPWLYSNSRWPKRSSDASPASVNDHFCPGFEQVLEWLIGQAAKSWKAAVSAIEQWNGPEDVDLGDYGSVSLNDNEQEYFRHRYARACLASAYLISESSVEALKGAHSILAKVTSLVGQDPIPNLQMTASLLSPLPELCESDIISPKNTTYMRNDLLNESNILTSPTKISMQCLHALIMSAFLLTRAGIPCSVRRAGELVLIGNEYEQKEVYLNLIVAISDRGRKSDSKYWTKSRNEMLWLQDFGAEEALGSSEQSTLKVGIFGQLNKEFMETEILKALLLNNQYSLARSLYEDSSEEILPTNILQDTIFSCAMHAYDNASNLFRTRGGVKKCDDIVYAFPKTMRIDLPEMRRTEALLKATNALSGYKLVLKQGEPFTPVNLRAHSDPIAIIGKVLEQNHEAYTQAQDMVEIGMHMVEAGLTLRDKKLGHSAPSVGEEAEQRRIAEKRVTSMCIEAALANDDFETAYSYVTSRLSTTPTTARTDKISDDWSWKAALQAGKYRLNARTTRPTHLGTASGNREIRHLEQRIECLSTALRIAPPAALTEILNAFRRCEEELDNALRTEEESEDAWDNSADNPRDSRLQSVLTHGRQVEEPPMSLFDLSRATVFSAQRNLTALSSLGQAKARGLEEGGSLTAGESEDDGGGGKSRVRKRDQLRDAAVGTLVSGVGWLVGAQPVDRRQGSD